MPLRIAQFLALILTAVSLVPSAAHLFEMAPKLALSEEDYFVVQQIYAGWALFGIAIFGALAADLAVAFLLRRERAPALLALLAAGCVAASLAVFFTWTFPANQATANWTEFPPNWAELRSAWEYSHAVNALLMFAGFCALVLSTLISGRK
jgi:ribose/xylose/arabinose/galactoside ABC-type transport system permease subunit